MESPASSPRNAVVVAVALMAIAAAENTVAPWAPFYFVYAALTLVLPFALGAVKIGRPALPRWPHWIAAVVVAVGLQLAFRPLADAVDLAGMFGTVFAAAGLRLKHPPDDVGRSYLLFIVVWAALGEELFYRGYLQARLRRRYGAATAIGVAAFLFAIRHYTQVLLAWPQVPWWPATIWVAVAFVLGVAIGWLYEKSASLLPPIACHYLFNLLG